jgi:hypothetical protein
MNFQTISNDNDSLDAVVPSAVADAINNISNGYDAVINRNCSNVIVVSIDVNLSTRIPEVVDNKVLDWDRVVDVYLLAHTNIDDTSDTDSSDYDYVDYFQDDPNPPLIHISDYDSAPEGNNYDDMNNNNHDDDDDDFYGDHDTDTSDSLF